MLKILLPCAGNLQPGLRNRDYGKVEPSPRVSTPLTAYTYLSKRVRAFLPSTTGRKLPSRTPAPFHTAKSSLSWGDKIKADDLLLGRFHFAGQLLDVDPWITATPSRRFAVWLHEFDWLHDLLALLAGKSDAHSDMARNYVDGWIDTYGKGNEFVSDPERLARRLFNWLALWSPALSISGTNETDISLSGSSRRLDRRRSSVLRQLTLLRGSIKSIPHGVSRLTAGCALALGGARLTEGRSQFLERGLDLLDAELPIQILPDGGHISRSPETCVTALRHLLTLDSILADRGLEGSRVHGGGEIAAANISKLLKIAPGDPKAFSYGPHVGFQRLEANGTVALIDTGEAPPRPFDTRAHLAPLALDLPAALAKNNQKIGRGLFALLRRIRRWYWMIVHLAGF